MDLRKPNIMNFMRVETATGLYFDIDMDSNINFDKGEGKMRLDKKAKLILRKIKEYALQNDTYYVITSIYSPESGNPYQKIASEMGCDGKIWSDVYELHRRYERFKFYVREVHQE